MLQRFVLVPLRPIPHPFEHFSARLGNHLPQQHAPHSRDEKASEVDQVQTCRLPLSVPGAYRPAISVCGRYQQQPGIFLDPLHLPSRQLRENPSSRCFTLKLQVRQLVFQALAEGTDKSCTVLKADELREELPVTRILQQHRHGTVHGGGIVEEPQCLPGITRQVKYDAPFISRLVMQVNQQAIDHRFPYCPQQHGFAFEPLLSPLLSGVQHFTQGKLHIDAYASLQSRKLGRQLQPRTFVFSQHRLGSWREDPLQRVLITLTYVQIATGRNQCFQRCIQWFVAAWQNQPRALVVAGIRSKVAHQPQ